MSVLVVLLVLTVVVLPEAGLAVGSRLCCTGPGRGCCPLEWGGQEPGPGETSGSTHSAGRCQLDRDSVQK